MFVASQERMTKIRNKMKHERIKLCQSESFESAAQLNNNIIQNKQVKK